MFPVAVAMIITKGFALVFMACQPALSYVFFCSFCVVRFGQPGRASVEQQQCALVRSFAY